MSALFEVFPTLRGRVAWTPLGVLPTPVEDVSQSLGRESLAGELWLKRDDLSSPIYGGNKLRLLEHLLAEATARGATHIYSSGAVGSNFAVATTLHARRVGLVPGALCFPQPLTADGEASHRVVARLSRVIELAHWSLLPLATERVRRRAEREGERAHVLSQVRYGAESLLGYVAAGVELAQQVEARACPAPRRIVLPIGSAATTSGILAGLALAMKLGIWKGPAPTVAAVRIAAWPLSRRGRILSLAEDALACLSRMVPEPALALRRQELPPLELVTDQLGSGYPHATSAGQRARQVFEAAGYPILDDTYSAKAAAHALSAAPGLVLLWATKSSAPLPR